MIRVETFVLLTASQLSLTLMHSRELLNERSNGSNFSVVFSHSIKILAFFDLDNELSMLRESDVCKLTKELEREKIKRKQLEIKLKNVKQDHDTTSKLRLCHILVIYYVFP